MDRSIYQTGVERILFCNHIQALYNHMNRVSLAYYILDHRDTFGILHKGCCMVVHSKDILEHICYCHHEQILLYKCNQVSFLGHSYIWILYYCNIFHYTDSKDQPDLR
jgi:hypothetical protein